LADSDRSRLLLELEDPFTRFQRLMSQRVEHVLLVSSLYDSFILAQDAQLSELFLNEFLELNLRHTPGLTSVTSGAQALQHMREDERYSLVVTSPHVGDMDALELARRIQADGHDVPVVLLGYDHRELKDFVGRHDTSAIDRVFLWRGDVRIFLAITKYIEDKLNVASDTSEAGVQVIILIEDSIRYYSSFLPIIYTELFRHSERVIPEGVNVTHKIMRMRARPKILLTDNFEEAWQYFDTYKDNVLGVISDIAFPRDGVVAPQAGLQFARQVRQVWGDVPVLLQSGRAENAQLAAEVGVSFVRKGSSTLLHDLQTFMVNEFAFGDFIFRTPDGQEVDRADSLPALIEKMRSVPVASIEYHGARNDFSRWLKARTEFALAEAFRQSLLSDFEDLEHARMSGVERIEAYQRDRQGGVVTDFNAASFDQQGGFARLGGGSLGGKARGLAFARRLLSSDPACREFDGVRIFVPPSVVLGTDIFDAFLDQNDLREFALTCTDDADIGRRFLEAEFPWAPRLQAFLAKEHEPLAVRSSSLLEDSHSQPFTGVYDTIMLPNAHAEIEVRLRRLLDAVKRVYASVFSSRAKAYVEVTPYRLEEEKMAVIIQRVVGARHGPRYYPDFSGVARSRNFYPVAPMESEDGFAAVALGLGRTVVEGETCLRFCPRYPRHLVQFSSAAEMLRNTQRDFWSLVLDAKVQQETELPAVEEARFGLDVAEADGTLALLGSTYTADNDAVHDGLSRSGPRLVSFAPILKHRLFPLAEILDHLLELVGWGVNAPVEVEFAVNLSPPRGQPQEFALLQMRPLALSREEQEIDIGQIEDQDLVCRSTHVLGNGRDEVLDLVMVDYQRLERTHSGDVAREVARLNAQLMAQARPYVLIGVGRWGSTDPALGIPVNWEDVAGARAIVESGFRDFQVTPSQGTHFFQNLTAFNVGYFTVNDQLGNAMVDWDWLEQQPSLHEAHSVRHLRFADPLVVSMDGRKGEGAIVKPGRLAREG
jgi:CheY-like chemotaxis protein